MLSFKTSKTKQKKYTEVKAVVILNVNKKSGEEYFKMFPFFNLLYTIAYIQMIKYNDFNSDKGE